MHLATHSLKAFGLVTFLGLAMSAVPALAHDHLHRPVTLVTVTRSLDVAAIRLSDDIADQGDQVAHFQDVAQKFTDAAEHLRLSVLMKEPMAHLMADYHVVLRTHRDLNDELYHHGSTPMIDRDMRVVANQLKLLAPFFQKSGNGGQGKGDGHDHGDGHDDDDDHDEGQGQGQSQSQGQNKGNGQGQGQGPGNGQGQGKGQGNGQGQGQNQGGVGLQLGKVKILIKKP